MFANVPKTKVPRTNVRKCPTFSLALGLARFKIDPSAREEKKIIFSLRFFSKPRFLQTEIFGRLESKFETLSAPEF